MRKFYFLSTLVLTILHCSKSYAQDFSNKGKDFWLGYGYHQIMSGGNNQELVLYFATDQVTTVTVSIPGTGYSVTYPNIPANTVFATPPAAGGGIPKSGPQDARMTTQGLFNRGIHIVADKPIVAYAHIYTQNVSGATILFPTNTLGKEYYSINYRNISNTNNSNCWFYVVATDTGTTRVEITPSANTTGGWVAGTTYTVSLTQGEIYNVMGVFTNAPPAPASGADLTGSKVVSVASASGGCKKIAVYSGSGRISITCNGTSSSSDYYMTQAFPKTAWGKKYLTVPTGGPMANNIYRICVADPTTIVTHNGAPIAVPLQNNFYYELPASSNPNLIEADKPVCVAQYITSQGHCGNGNPGDPEVIYLSPVEQNIARVLFYSTPNTVPNINQHYYSVIIRNSGTAISSFTLDGVPVPPASFTLHPQDAGYSYLTQAVTAGQHTIQSDSGFNGTAYGYGPAESYGFNIGTNIRDLFQFIQLINPYGTVPFPATCRGTPFNFAMVFPYRPIQINWIFGPVLNAMGINDTTIYNAGNPIIEDSSWVVSGRTVYRYRLPRTYYITAVGTYPIKVVATNPTPDGCGNEQTIDFDVQVFEPPIADFNITTDGCVTSPVSFTDNSNTAGRPIISRYWDFGDASNSILAAPTHLYAAAGTYNVKYTLITDVGCLADTVTHPVTLNNPPVANFTISAPLCPNVPVQFTDVSTASGGAIINQWAWDFGDGGTSTLQNPSHTYLAAGTYNVTLIVSTTTGCPSPVFSFPVVIVPDGTITLSSAPGTDNQTVCINTPITNITYIVTLSSNGGSVSGLPAGVTGSFAAGVITITGTPTVSGVYNYTVTTTGPCVNPTAFGTITVTPDGTITLTSAPGTDNQTVCINTPITNITYAVGASGNGGSVSGLPAGVTGSFAGGVITISGTPTVSGTFNYNVNSTGPCFNPTASGTITVTPDGTITLTSAPGTNNQTVCINTSIINITYAVGASSNGGSVSGLPAGVSGSYSAGVITISGSPTVSGTFNYTVNTTGPCVNPTASGTITVTQDGTITLTSAAGTDNQAVCINSPITNITYLVAGSGTGGSVIGLPVGVTGSFAGGIITISGTPTVSGTFNYTVNTTGPCVTPSATGTILVYPLPTANFTYSAPSCETYIINFTDVSVANAGTVSGWSWNFGDPGSGPNNTSNLQNPSHIFSTAGTYNVTLIVTTSNGCVSTTPSQTVTIYPRPLAGYIVPAVCLSDTYAQFTDTSSVDVPDNIVAWDWNFGDPGSGPLNVSTLQNPQHSYTATGVYNVRLIVTTNRGCKDTVTHALSVNGSFPVAGFTVQNPTILCANDSVAISESSTVFPGVITKIEIYWDNVGQPAVFDTDNSPFSGKIYKHLYPNFQAPLTRVFTIRYRAYSGGVCVDDSLRNITVNAAPSVQFNPMPNICYDAAPYQIPSAIASEIGGVPGNGIFTGPGVSLTGLFTPSVAGVGTHRILYTFTSTAGGCVDTASNLIRVWDTASAQIGVQPLLCENLAVSFNSTASTISAGNGTITGWNWNFGDPPSGPSNTSTLQNPTHSFTGWGNYNVTLSVITSNGCISTIRTLPVFVNPEPKPNFSTPPSSCLPDATVAFTNSSTIADGTQASFSYLWNFGDPPSGINNTSILVNPSHVYTTTGPFNVSLQVTSGAGCVNSVTIPLTTVHPQPLGAFTTDKIDVCIGSSILFTNTSNPMDGTATQFNWTMGDGNTRSIPVFNYTYNSVGSYDVSLFIINSHGCRSTTANKTVFVNPYPVANAGPDKFMLEGGQVMLTPVLVTNMPVSYLWVPPQNLSNPAISNPIATPPDDITYTLQVTSDKGCTTTDNVFIKVLKLPAIPNIFSPNGDGIHDTWVIEYLDTYPGSTIDIFNRYGQKIYHSDGYTKPWDGTINGKPVPIGTYYYIVNPKNGRKIMSGYVDVIR
jgi:gliding motility-associated-like protein